jgi:transposase-like protein
MTAHKVRIAREMYSSGQYTVAAIAKTLGVSRTSIYRHRSCATGGAPDRTADAGDPYSQAPAVLRRVRFIRG